VARSASKRRLNGMRLLVVEDNLINQQVAEELLNSEGALVSLAANGQLGVDAVAAADPQFDAVLMDIQMPVMDGYVATREIRTRLGLTSLPIVAMTANAMPTDREECLAAGMSEHVGKPFDLAHLAGLLLRLTGFEPVTGTVDGELDTQAGSAEVQSTPELDVQGALARMSGIKSLYVRSAREFSKSLTQVVDHYRSAVESSRWAQAAMQMHTLKGTAATLGANGLSKEAAALEKLCKAEPPSVQTALAPIAALASAVRAAQLAIDNAVFLMDSPAQTADVPAKEAALAPVDVAAAQAALGQLADLLAQGDMAALEVHATARSALAGLAQESLDRLEEAMQSLDFDGALAATKELLALLPQ
jgi:CheY-like chemotaxis protein